jgi:hypothetical protein
MTLHTISIQIQLKINGVQICGNSFENMVLNMMLECFLKYTNLKICLSIPLFTHEWYKQIVVLKCRSDDLQLMTYQT